MLRSFRLLNLRRLAHRPLRAALAIAAVAAGTTLPVTIYIVSTSLDRSVRDYALSFAGPAPLSVVGPKLGGLSESALPRVEETEGVRAAVPMVQAVTLADGNHPEVPIIALGFDCRVEALVGEVGCREESLATATVDTPPLLSLSLARRLGPTGTIRTHLGAKAVRDAPVIEGLDEINQGYVAAYPLHVSQQLFTRLGVIDAIYVLPEQGTDTAALRQRLQDAVGHHNGVLTVGDSPAQLQLFTQLLAFVGLVGIFTLAIGGLLVHNAMALSLDERRRDLAVASALGGKARTIFGATLLEGAAVGFLGGLAGALAGTVLAFPLTSNVQSVTERAGAIPIDVHLTALPIVLGALLGILVGTAAAIRPARRASRLDVVAELRGKGEAAAPDAPVSRWGFAFVLIGLTGIALSRVAARDHGLEPWQPLVAQIALLLTVVFLGAAVVSFAPHAFRLSAGLARRLGVTTRLGWANLAGEGSRSANMVLAAAAAIGMAIVIASAAETVTASVVIAAGEDNADRVIVYATPTLTNTINLEVAPPVGAAEAIRRLEGVADVEPLVGFAGRVGGGGFFAVEGRSRATFPFEVIRGAADAEAFHRGEVLIGPSLARQEGVRPGDSLRLPGRDGFVDLTVQGIWLNGDWGGAEVTMPLALLEQIWGTQTPGALAVTPEPGVSPVELARRIEAAGIDPHLSAAPPDQVLRDATREIHSLFVDPFWAIQRVVLVVAFAGVLSNLLLVASRRQRELGLVSAVGMAPRSIARMVLSEGAGIALLGFVGGTLLAVAGYEVFRHVTGMVFPYVMPYRFVVSASFIYGAITLAVVVAAALLPAWRASRLQVVEALRYE